jgi:tRNA-uridine 2-sulfurtransferase
MKIVVAMSGGVDSSVAAALLVEQGHEVIGLAMKTHDEAPRQNRACCTPDDMRDARRVADTLAIPFYVLNYAQLFSELVVRPFVDAYRAGRTPNPCVECNDKVKFVPMLERARLLGADKLATGHYARLEKNPTWGYTLHRGRDTQKDQSYFLYRLKQNQLSDLLFPLGEMTKSNVREHARRFGLPVAQKAESQEICFVGEEGYADVVEKLGGSMQPGDIKNEQGEVMGQHRGIHRYTIGQRRGLGVSSPEPLYVTGVDPENHIVYVGSRTDLMSQQVRVDNIHWSQSKAWLGERVGVQQRYRESPKEGVLEALDEGGVRVRFEEGVSRGAPGQAAVFYSGDRVVGGGTLAASQSTGLRILNNEAR